MQVVLRLSSLHFLALFFSLIPFPLPHVLSPVLHCPVTAQK